MTEEVVKKEVAEEKKRGRKPKLTEKIEVLKAPLYDRLSVQVPPEFLFSYEEDGKKFTGYKTQYAINLLNKEVGLTGWGTQETLLKEINTDKGTLVVMKILIELTDSTVVGTASVTGFGGAYARRAENAYKGAKSSAFKNACRYLGIGNELYLAGHDEDEVVYEKVTEEQPVDSVGEVSNEIKLLEEAIRGAVTPGKLLELVNKINQIPVEKIKIAMIDFYNRKMMELKS